MRLTLAQIEAFFWTARLGSVVAAAARLGLTQPSVSLRLKDLRAVIGMDLFQRSAQGLQLTLEGRQLLEQATSMLAIAQGMSASSHSDISGPFRLGLAEGFAIVCLPRLLPELTRTYPSLSPELTIMTSVVLEDQLLQGGIDLAVLVNPTGTGLQLTPLGVQMTSWVRGPGWDLPEPATPEDLAELPIIVNPPPSTMYRRMMNWFATAAVQPINVSLCSSGAVTLQMAAAGIALSLAPVNMIRAHPQAGLLRELAVTPAVGPGHVYIGQRAGMESRVARGVSAVIARVVEEMGHLKQGQ